MASDGRKSGFGGALSVRAATVPVQLDGLLDVDVTKFQTSLVVLGRSNCGRVDSGSQLSRWDPTTSMVARFSLH